MDLSYGENPHQRAALYVEAGARTHVLTRVSKLHGKALSFNNVLDLDSARSLLGDLEGPACVIVKHNNPCGAAEARRDRGRLREGARLRPALGLRRRDRAQPADRRGAGRAAARELRRGADRARLRGRGARRSSSRRRRSGSSRTPSSAAPRASWTSSGSAAGCSSRSSTRVARDRERMEVATRREPSEEQWVDLLFAWKVCKHVRSNAIVLAKDRRDDRHRRRPDEPGRLGPARVEKAATPAATRPTAQLDGSRRRLRRLLPVRRRPAGRDRGRRARSSSSPAARSATPRSSRLRGGRRDDGLHRPPRTSGTRSGLAGRGIIGHGRATARSRSGCRASSARRRASSATRSASCSTGRRPADDRQALARHLGYSETVFVDDAAARPDRDLHAGGRAAVRRPPTVGTAWLLARRGSSSTCCARPPARSRSAARARSPGCGRSRSGARPGSWSSTAPAEEVDALAGRRAAGFHYVWAWIDEGAGLVRARCFVPEAGVEEDEATGSAALPLSAALGRPIEVRQGAGSVIHARPVGDGFVEIGGRVVED